MSFAETTGGKMTHWILTEHPAPSTNGFLICNIVWTQRKNIGIPHECINNATPTDPLLEPQLLEANIVVLQEEDNGPGETPADDSDIDEAVRVGNEMENELEIKDSMDPSELTDVYDQFEVEDSKDNYSFVEIINHCW